MKIKQLTLCFIIFNLKIFAAQPQEYFHIIFDSLSYELKTESIGILTINQDIKRNRKLIGYKKINNSFICEGEIDIIESTIPVSHWGFFNTGYFPPNGFENYRYPVLDSLGNFLKICYNCHKNLKTWIKIDDFNRDFSPFLLMFHQMVKTQNNYFLEPFFNPNNEIKIYNSPNKDSTFKIININDRPSNFHCLRVMQQKNQFIQIISYIEIEGEHPLIYPIGWIKIKDENDKLYFWIKYIDFH